MCDIDRAGYYINSVNFEVEFAEILAFPLKLFFVEDVSLFKKKKTGKEW